VSHKSKTEFSILCPGEDSWDLWRAGTSGLVLDSSVPIEEGGPASFKHARLFGCPVTSAFAVPVWVASVDPEIIRSAVELQLEKLNLRSEEGGGNLIESQVIEQTESQTLLLVTVLNERNLREFSRDSPGQFEVTPSLFFLPDNSLVLWKELEKLVAAITRGDRLIYFQALSSGELDAQAAHELQLLVMQLELQGVLGELESVVVWSDAIESGADAMLKETLGLPIRRERKPPPAPPPQASTFLPNQIAQARVRASRLRRIRQVSAAAAAVYLLAAGAFAFFSIKEVRGAGELRAKSKRLESEVGWVANAQGRWLRMLDVTHADRYPLERFYQLSKSLDEASKVRLTKFVFDPEKLSLSGEAQDITRAINYMNAIKRDPSLSEYNWENPPPKTERGGTASFQMNGTSKNAAPVQ
jgi:hypothetical protein